MDGLNIVGLGSILTGDASDAREPGAPIVTLSEAEIAKRVKSEKRAKARAEAKAADKVAAEDHLYQIMAQRGIEAVRLSESEAHAWKILGLAVYDVYGKNGAERFEESRDQFTADCIIPGLDDKTKIEGLDYTRRGLMMLDMPRAGTNDAASFPNFTATREAKNELARYVKSKLWKRILDYAYPAEKAEKVKAPATDEAGEAGETVEGLTLAKYAATIGTLLKQLQASEGIEGLNITKATEALTVALSAVSK